MKYKKIFAFSWNWENIDIQYWEKEIKPAAIESGFTKFEMERIKYPTMDVLKITTEADTVEDMIELAIQLGMGLYRIINESKNSREEFEIVSHLFNE